MKVRDVQSLIEGLDADEEINMCIKIGKESSIGATPTIKVEGIYRGFDWDTGKIIIVPKEELCRSLITYKQMKLKRLMWVSDNLKWVVEFSSTNNGIISTNYGYNTKGFRVKDDDTIELVRGCTKYSIKSIPKYVLDKIKSTIAIMNKDITKLRYRQVEMDKKADIVKLHTRIYRLEELEEENKDYVII